jgi:hypothetical protein
VTRSTLKYDTVKIRLWTGEKPVIAVECCPLPRKIYSSLWSAKEMKCPIITRTAQSWCSFSFACYAAASRFVHADGPGKCLGGLQLVERQITGSHAATTTACYPVTSSTPSPLSTPMSGIPSTGRAYHAGYCHSQACVTHDELLCDEENCVAQCGTRSPPELPRPRILV